MEKVTRREAILKVAAGGAGLALTTLAGGDAGGQAVGAAQAALTPWQARGYT